VIDTGIATSVGRGKRRTIGDNTIRCLRGSTVLRGLAMCKEAVITSVTARVRYSAVTTQAANTLQKYPDERISRR
jgi:hypothetical protein